MDLPSLVTFGSQIALPNPKHLSAIRSFLIQADNSEILVQAIRDLHSVWEAFSKTLTVAYKVPGRQILDQLQQWIQTGRPIEVPEVAPNILLAPLTLVTQLYE